MSTPEARRYDRGLWLLERLSLNQLRRELLQYVQGDVLEIGLGTGVNLPWYANGSRVVGIDIDTAKMAGVAQRKKPHQFGASCADAQALPFQDQSFDTVVGTLVFCCIPDPALALSEIRRVMRPDGRLLLLEHVRGQGPVSRRLTDWLHPAWYGLQGVCHLNRETAASVERSGFQTIQVNRHGWGVLQTIVARPIVAHPVEADR